MNPFSRNTFIIDHTAIGGYTVGMGLIGVVTNTIRGWWFFIFSISPKSARLSALFSRSFVYG